MIGLQVLGADVVAARLRRLGERMDAAERGVAVKGSILLRKLLVKRMSARAPSDPFWGKGSPAGPYLGGRTGQTRARLSPGGQAFKFLGRWQAAVGSPDAHVAMHETGGTITGRQFLRIPTAAAQTRGGEDRNKGRSIRDIPGAFLFRSGDGKLWAAFRGAGDSKVTLLYLLVRSIRLRGRGLFAATAQEIEPQIREIGNAEIRPIVREAHGSAT